MFFIDYRHLMYNAILLDKDNQKAKKEILKRSKLALGAIDKDGAIFERENWNNTVICAHLKNKIDVIIEGESCIVSGIMADKTHSHILYLKLDNLNWKRSKYAQLNIES